MKKKIEEFMTGYNEQINESFENNNFDLGKIKLKGIHHYFINNRK